MKSSAAFMIVIIGGCEVMKLDEFKIALSWKDFVLVKGELIKAYCT
jgi:hypothetical protein